MFLCFFEKYFVGCFCCLRFKKVVLGCFVQEKYFIEVLLILL